MTTVEQEIRYLDLDGDGLPDAVLTVETLSAVVLETGTVQRLETIETLETGIDIEGHARDVQVSAHPA